MQQRLCEGTASGGGCVQHELQRKLRPFCAQLADEMQMQSRQIGCLSTPATAKPAAVVCRQYVQVNELGRVPPRNQTNVARRKAKVTICTKSD